MTFTGGLVKVGDGELYLAGAGNGYSGGTTVQAGTPRGNIAAGTDLALNSGAVYDGDNAARSVGELGGYGSVENTDGLTVASGYYGGDIGGSNTGGLAKVSDGDLYLFGENAYSGGTTVSGGRLLGDSLSLRGDIRNDSVLGFVQTGDGIFDGQISGAGDLLKFGAGALVLDGGQAAGKVEIHEGGLIVGGTSSQAAVRLDAGIVNVYGDALLGGHGTVGSDVVVHALGRLSPGNSYGRTYIDGGLEFKPGSFFDVEVNPFDSSEGDVVIVRGTAILAGIVRHFGTGGGADDYVSAGREWLILDAASLSGTFDGAVSDLAFLRPLLRYDDSNADVFMSFERGASFGDFADTHNRRSVAAALESLDPGSGLYREIVGATTLDQARGLLDELSGEMHGAVNGGLFQLGRGFGNMLSRHVSGLPRGGPGAAGTMAPAGGSASGPGGHSFWASAGGTYTVLRGTAETARATLAGPEIATGYDGGFGDGWLGGLAFQYGYKKLKMDGRRSEADVKSFTLGLYGGREIPLGPGALRLLLSGTYSHHDIESTRRVGIGGQDQTLSANYAANSIEGNLEAAYLFPVSESLSLEPFARIGLQRLRIGGFDETGGSAALTTGASTWNHAVSTAGLRLSLAATERVSFSADLGWQHVFGNLVPAATYAFREGGSGFSVHGAPMNRDEALVGLDLGVRVTEGASFHLGYNGAFGKRGQSHGGMAMIEVRW
jgi:autotransporter-associated beta strand protein